MARIELSDGRLARVRAPLPSFTGPTGGDPQTTRFKDAINTGQVCDDARSRDAW